MFLKTGHKSKNNNRNVTGRLLVSPVVAIVRYQYRYRQGIDKGLTFVNPCQLLVLCL